MKLLISAFGCGLLFGVGLIVSGMTDPAVVVGFLDITGDWNPALAWVMAGALVASFRVTYLDLVKRERSVLGETMQIPTARLIDGRLLAGAAIFGIGWGLAGLCPGPALTNLGRLDTDILVFVIAMIAGQQAVGLLPQK